MTKNAKRILIVDDEAPLRFLLSKQLTRAGFEVVAAADVEAALAALAAHPDVALVITDVVMPRLDGPALLDRLRTSHPATKLIVMSGYPDDVIASHGMLDPGVSFLAKPFSIGALGAMVREVLDA